MADKRTSNRRDDTLGENPLRGVEFGSVLQCPTCKGKGAWKSKGEEFPCRVCDGKCVVPNKGAIA